jgi:hypothetical protein
MNSLSLMSGMEREKESNPQYSSANLAVLADKIA